MTKISLKEDPLTPYVSQIGDAVGDFIEWWGFKHVHGRIWALLALHREPMSQIEISRALGVSRSLISTAIAELGDYSLVKPVSDHRNAPYSASMDVWKAISMVLRQREWMLIEKTRVALEAASDEAHAIQLDGDVTAYDTARIELILNLTEAAKTMLKMIIALGSARKPKGFSGWLDQVKSLAETLRRI